MIYLGLGLLVLSVSVVQAASITQQTEGWCSPAIGQTGGNVTITMNCPGVDPKVLLALNERYNKTNRDLQQKTREADEWARKYRELFQKAEASPDKNLAWETKDLLRQGKLEEADTRLRRSAISMAQYQALQPGMSYQEVVRVFGRPGEEVGRGENFLGYVWRNADLSMVTVVFINGRMHNAGQSGLQN